MSCFLLFYWRAGFWVPGLQVGFHQQSTVVPSSGWSIPQKQRYITKFSSCRSQIPYRPGFLKNVHPYLFPQSPILSISPSLPATFIPLSRNLFISPLLKKPTLDKEEFSSYRTISNLSLISKIIERVVKSRLTDHLTSNSLLNSHQSAYCKHHSTETALLYIHDHLISAIGSQIMSLSTRPLCCFRHYSPWHLDHPPLILVWHCQGWVASVLKFKKDWLQMYKNDDNL